MKKDKNFSSTGQGFNDLRGEIPDMKDIPKYNGQNLNNDPAHHRAKEPVTAVPIVRKSAKNHKS